MTSDARALPRYVRRLRSYLREPLTLDAARAAIRRAAERREQALLTVLERGVYARRQSPYRALLLHAGIELGDVRALLSEGAEAALERLRAEGVRVSLHELKGRTPIVRPGLELPVTAASFDNPLLAADFAGEGGGTTGAPRRLLIDLDLLAHEAAHVLVSRADLGLTGHPIGQWRAAPPGLAGVKEVLRYARGGVRVERWFTPYPLRVAPANARNLGFLAATLATARTFPRPRHVPLDAPEPIARWLAERGPALFSATPSGAVRICRSGLDLSGTVFRLGGEPYTAARERVLASAGARAVSHYAMSEVGKIGMPCGDTAARDDVHLLDDKLAALAPGGRLHLTTLMSTPKLLLNAETGDEVALTTRDCRCAYGALGLRRHVHDIRSYEKVNSEGMGPLGDEVVRLVDEVLPARFGGAASDYQLVEDGRGEVPRVTIVVSPRVGALSDAAVVEAVLEAVSGGAEHRRMAARLWRDAGTVRVERAEPWVTGAGKVPALRVIPRDPASRA